MSEWLKYCGVGKKDLAPISPCGLLSGVLLCYVYRGGGGVGCVYGYGCVQFTVKFTFRECFVLCVGGGAGGLCLGYQ